MRVFITGDRSMPSDIAVVNMAQGIAAFAGQAALQGETLRLMTGTNVGLEEGVRRIAEALEIKIDVLENPMTDDGKIDWDARHVAAEQSSDRVVVVHSDILASHIGASCIRVVPDEKLQLIGG